VTGGLGIEPSAKESGLNTLVLFLRTAIAGCSGVLVWVLVSDAHGADQTLSAAIVPVWVAGLVGGVVSAMFSPRQGITVAFTTGVMMALMFLAFRHVYLDMPWGSDTLQTLWPMWFPVAYYLGAFGYLTVLQRLYRR